MKKIIKTSCCPNNQINTSWSDLPIYGLTLLGFICLANCSPKTAKIQDSEGSHSASIAVLSQPKQPEENLVGESSTAICHERVTLTEQVAGDPIGTTRVRVYSACGYDVTGPRILLAGKPTR